LQEALLHLCGKFGRPLVCDDIFPRSSLDQLIGEASTTPTCSLGQFALESDDLQRPLLTRMYGALSERGDLEPLELSVREL